MKPCLALTGDGTKLQIPLTLAKGVNSTIARIRIALYTERGKWPDDVNFGLPWLSMTTLSEVEIEGLVRSLVGSLDGVLSITSCTVTKANEDLTVSLVLRLASDEGAAVVEIGALSTAGNYPETWYASLGYDYGSFC